MSVQIKVSSLAYGVLKKRAEENHRTIGGEVDCLLDNFVISKNPDIKVVSELPQPPKQEWRAMRGIGDVLKEIEVVKKQLSDYLSVCQDTDEQAKIKIEGGAKLDELWAEYHLLKGGK